MPWMSVKLTAKQKRSEAQLNRYSFRATTAVALRW